MSEGRKKTIFGQIFIAVVVAFLIGGTSPWWWKEFFGRKDMAKPIPEVHGENGPHRPGPPDNERPHPSRERPGGKDPHRPEIPEVENHTPPREDDNSRGRFVIVTVGAVLFPGPNRSEPGITDLPEGGSFRVLDKHIEEHDEGSEEWFLIDCGDTTGWVPARSVIREEER